MHKVGYIDCVQAKVLALYPTCLVKGSDHTGHPDESLARELAFSHNQLQDASPRQGW